MSTIPAINLGTPLSVGELHRQRERSTSLPPPSSTLLSSSSSASAPPSNLLINLRRIFATDSTSSPGSNLSSSDSSSPPQLPSSVVEGKEELTWSGKRVVWSDGVELVRSFSFEGRGEVLQAFFAWFDIGRGGSQDRPSSSQQEGSAPPSSSANGTSHHQSLSRSGPATFSSASSSSYSATISPRSSKARAVCFVFLDQLEIHFASGDRHVVHLPFPFGRAWPLDLGVLMQSSASQSTSIDALGHSSQQAPLFSLTDLYGEPRPVVLPPSPSVVVPQEIPGAGGDSLVLGAEIIFVSSRSSPLPIVVARSPSSGDVFFLRYGLSNPSPSSLNFLPLPPPVKPSPPLVAQPFLPPTSRLKPRASHTQARRRHSSLGPSESFANATSILPPSRTPISGTSKSAPEQDPMFANMTRGALPPSLDPSGLQDRRLSLGRHDLNKSMDRMVLNGEEDEFGLKRGPLVDGEEDLLGSSLELTVVDVCRSGERSVLEASSSIISDQAMHVSLLDKSTHLLSIYLLSTNSNHPSTLGLALVRTQPCLSIASNPPQTDAQSMILNESGQILLASAGLSSKAVVDVAQPPFPVDHDFGPPRQVLQLDTGIPSYSRSSPEVFDSLRTLSSSTISLKFGDGSSNAIKISPGPTGLVARCLQALDFALDPSQASELRLKLARRGGGTSTEWEPFVEQLLTVVGLRSSSNTPSSSGLRPWDRLCRSSQQSRDPALLALQPCVTPSGPSQPSNVVLPPPDLPRLAAVARSLHLLAEDCKLSLVRLVDLDRLAPLIARLASALGREDWVDYWFRVMPFKVGKDWLGPGHVTPSELLPSPPNIYTHLSSILQCRSNIQQWISLSDLSPPRPITSPPRKDPCSLTKGLLAVYSELGKASSSSEPLKQAAEAVLCIVSHGITIDKLLQVPFGVSLPLHEVIRTCQASPPSDWPLAAYELVQRSDMGRRLGVDRKKVAKKLDFSSQEVPSITSLTSTALDARSKRVPSSKPTTTSKAAPSSEQTLRFGSDRRMEEVDRMLSTSRTVTLTLPPKQNQSDQEIAAAQKTAAFTLAQRTSAISVGQGVFAFGSCSATLTRSWPISPVDFSVRILPQNIVLSVDTPTLGLEAREWSNFHNGVAAGLQISPESAAVDSSWVVFNRPAEQGSTHAGFLLGLGLTGHLRGMMPWHAFPYLDSRHDFTSIGLLLGLASSYAGTQDTLLTKILSLHVHALLPHGSRELNASPLTQAAALLGIGILYTGSRNRKMAEIALSEISRSSGVPPHDPLNDYREAYAFSAAMSFGMVMVGRGGKDRSPRDLEMVAQLRKGIFGSSLGAEQQSSSNQRGGGAETVVDVNITGPGATAALGLMYLRSDRQDMAEILDLPRSRFDLDLVRPDLLLVRTLSRSLILWSSISASQEWVESNVPSFIRSSMRKRKRDGAAQDHGVETAHSNIVAGACFAIGLKYAGTARSAVHSLLLHYYDVFWKASNVNPTSFEHRIRLSTARACLNVVAISLAVVMAGTGELSVLSRLRLAHGQQDKGVSYGSHMAIHMALGILFLGGGRYTLGSSDAAIAALVCAFFPRFNQLQADNRSYPQAYRHLWALAVEPRCFVAQDVDTGESVYLPIKVKLEEDGVVGSHHLISPTLLPPVERLVSVKIDSPRYWPINLDPVESVQDRVVLTQNHPVFVKRRAGFLSYAADPKGNRSIFVQAGLIGVAPDLGTMAVSRGSSAVGLEAVRDLVPSLTPDPFLVAFFRRLCTGSSTPSPPSSMSDFAGAAFLECLINDQPQILRLYLQIHQLRFARSSTPFLPILVRNLQMARNLPTSVDSLLPLHLRPSFFPPPIVRSSLLRQVESSLANLVDGIRADASFQDLLPRYAHSEVIRETSEKERQDLALYLVAGGVPPRTVLATLRHLVVEARRQSEHLSSEVGGASPEEAFDLERGMKIVLAATARRLGGEDVQGWEDRSVEEILSCW